MTRALALLAAAAVGLHAGDAFGQRAPAAAVPDGAAACAARLDRAREEFRSAADREEAPPRLGDVCGSVAAAIRAGPWSEALAPMDVEGLTPDAFDELLALMNGYAAPPDGERRLEAGALAAIVDGLRPFEPQPLPSLWERILEQLEEWLGLDGNASDNRFIEWLRSMSIPEAWARATFYALGALTIVGALAVLANELRLGGAFRGGRWKPARRGGIGPTEKRPAARTLDDLHRAPAAHRPVLLFAIVIERLAMRFGDPFRDSLTHREVTAAAGAVGLARRTDLDAVASAAERATFSAWHPGDGELDEVVAHGRAVLDEIDTPEPAEGRAKP